jgi:hypothetical protein
MLTEVRLAVCNSSKNNTKNNNLEYRFKNLTSCHRRKHGIVKIKINTISLTLLSLRKRSTYWLLAASM